MPRFLCLPTLIGLALLNAPLHSATESSEQKTEATTSNTSSADPVQQLPELVISSSRITALDVQIRKLTKKIDRSKRQLKKTSSLDESINTDDLPKLLSILGGYTTGQRKSLARERLMLMEAERSILEAMKHVRTHREEQELKTQLNTLKSMALLLEQS